jgi:hypothetical protein
MSPVGDWFESTQLTVQRKQLYTRQASRMTAYDDHKRHTFSTSGSVHTNFWPISHLIKYHSPEQLSVSS